MHESGKLGKTTGGPDLVPTAPDWPAWVGLMVTTHFALVSGPFWAPGGPKRAHFGPNVPFYDSVGVPDDPNPPAFC